MFIYKQNVEQSEKGVWLGPQLGDQDLLGKWNTENTIPDAKEGKALW